MVMPLEKLINKVLWQDHLKMKALFSILSA